MSRLNCMAHGQGGISDCDGGCCSSGPQQLLHEERHKFVCGDHVMSSHTCTDAGVRVDGQVQGRVNAAELQQLFDCIIERENTFVISPTSIRTQRQMHHEALD